jgi:hypothetical protein
MRTESTFSFGDMLDDEDDEDEPDALEVEPDGAVLLPLIDLSSVPVISTL